MKTLLFFLQIFLLMCGVFGADEVKTVSVMEGDSVTLNPDLTQIQGVNEILWRFGGSTIAKKDGNDILYEDVKGFKDRLQLDQTGSLTITNVRINHSGLYKAEIRHNSGTSYQTFSLTVYESPSVIAQTEAESKSVSVTEGDPVTLHVPQIQGDELIVWRFGDEGKLIAKADIEAKSSPLYDETDGRFRDRLKLNEQTGSLIITNTRTTDSGEYKVKISSNKQTLYKRFIVTVIPGLSGAAKALIVIGVLLLLTAAVAGVIYYFLRPITTNLPSQTWSVPEGVYITLNPETEIQRGDEIQWLFGAGEILIAEIKGENREKKTYDGPDLRFMNRLKLDKTTGSLTITNILTKHTGRYTLKIRRGRETLKKRFNVFVSEMMRIVMEGDPVLLYPDTTIQKGDEVQWLFGDEEQTVLTEIKNTKVTEYAGTDWRFRDRLKLDEETGSLTITNITAAHTGYYTLKITRDRDKIYKRFYISVTEREITKMEGKSVTLNPVYEIKKDDLIRWLFGDREQQTLIAEFNGKTGEILTYADVADGRFRDRLELDKTTRSLTINNTRTTDSGVYRLEIRSSRGFSEQTITVTVCDNVEEKFLNKGDSVTLNPDTEIQRDDQILWMFGYQDKVIAQIRGGTVDIYDNANERFRDRLKLDKKTGSLTIRKIEAKHIGRYKLLIIRSKEILCKKFKVSIKERFVAVTVGEPVHLNTGLTEIQRDEEIEWRFGDENSLIAEIKGGKGETHDVPDQRFRDRLELNETTGDLIIKNSTDEHAGRYKLKISSSKGYTNRTYTVTIRERYVAVTAGDSVHLNTGLTEIQRDEEIEWRFGKENSLIAEIKGGTVETHVLDQRFRGRLELNKKTGDLIIKNSTDEHAGHYKLKIRSSKGNTNWTYSVIIRERFVAVTVGEPVHLNTGLTEIQREDEMEWRFGDKNSLIAEIKGGTVETHDVPDQRFRDRLELDEKTGNLIIKNSRDEHAGRYKLKISSSKGYTNRTYTVTIRARKVEVAAGESVHLNTGLTEIQRDDEIEWRLGNSLIAEIKGGTVVTHDGPNERFRDRLELDEKTGNLIIKNSSYGHTGCYTLKISSSKGNTNWTYSVIIRERFVAVTVGEPVHLNTGLTEIQRDEEIEWRFGDENSLIAEIKGGKGETHDVPDQRFRDRLELDEKTGDLIIKNSTDEHAGRYKLKISSSKGYTNRTYTVTIRARTESLMKEKTDPREERLNESVTVEMEKKPLLNRDDLNVVNEEERTSSL